MHRSPRRCFALLLFLAVARPSAVRAAEPEPPPAPPPATFILPDEPPPRLGDLGVPYLHVETTAPRLELRVFDGIMPSYESSRRRSSRVVSRFVCAAPCDQLIDAREGARYFFSGPRLTTSEYFRLDAVAGPVAVRVQAGSRRALNDGLIVSAFGALFTFVGGILLGVGLTAPHLEPDASSLRIAGATFLGGAAIAWIVGPLLVSRGVTSFRFSPSGQRAADSAPAR